MRWATSTGSLVIVQLSCWCLLQVSSHRRCPRHRRRGGGVEVGGRRVLEVSRSRGNFRFSIC